MVKPSSQTHAPANDALERFLLHESILVRESVGFYLYEAWSRDANLIPLILEGCRRFGEEASFSLLGFAERFHWSGEALLDAVRELELSRPARVEKLLGTAPLGWVAAHEDLLRSVLSSETWSRIERRRALASLSTIDLWKRLTVMASGTDDRGLSREDELALDDVHEALVARETRASALETVQKLDELAGYYLKLRLIELAGAMSLHELTGNLIECLDHDDDDVADTAAAAIGRMATPQAVESIRKQYRERRWHFRLHALASLGPIKTAKAERTLHALLEIEDDPALRGRILDALRFRFTEAAATLIREEIREPSSWMLDTELKKALWVNAIVLGRHDPEAESWLFDDDTVEKDGILFHIPVMDVGHG